MAERSREPQPWPDPERPGVPLTPERDGWHWVETAEGHLVPYEWSPAGECERGRWPARWLFDVEAEIDPRTCRYVAPCLTPAEVAAQIAAAVASPLAQMRRLYHHAQTGGTVTPDDLSRVIAMMERARGEGGGDAG